MLVKPLVPSSLDMFIGTGELSDRLHELKDLVEGNRDYSTAARNLWSGTCRRMREATTDDERAEWAKKAIAAVSLMTLACLAVHNERPARESVLRLQEFKVELKKQHPSIYADIEVPLLETVGLLQYLVDELWAKLARIEPCL